MARPWLGAAAAFLLAFSAFPFPDARADVIDCRDSACMKFCEDDHRARGEDPAGHCFLIVLDPCEVIRCIDIPPCLLDVPPTCPEPDPCPPDAIHTYVAASRVGAGSTVLFNGGEVGAGQGNVVSSNPDCPGELDLGAGTGFFGYGPWADEPICDRGLHVHAGHVQVIDFVLGSRVPFVLGEDDQAGPVIVTDPETGATACETSGSITPGDPTVDPLADADDCLTPVYHGAGSTCGSGGGDGGYWVFILGAHLREEHGNPTLHAGATGGFIAADW